MEDWDLAASCSATTDTTIRPVIRMAPGVKKDDGTVSYDNNLLGTGASGVAVRCLLLVDSKRAIEVACKFQSADKTFYKEVAILQTIESRIVATRASPNFSRFYGAFVCDDGIFAMPALGGWSNVLWWMTPLMKTAVTDAGGLGIQLIELGTLGVLDDLMMDDPESPTLKSKAFHLQLVHGMASMHSIGLFHRDVKPSNIVFAELTRHTSLDRRAPTFYRHPAGVLKSSAIQTMPMYIDFGGSVIAEDSGNTMLDTIVGTVSYLPPEFVFSVSAKVDGNDKVDIFSLGITLAEMVIQSFTILDLSSEDPTWELVYEVVSREIAAYLEGGPSAAYRLTNLWNNGAVYITNLIVYTGLPSDPGMTYPLLKRIASAMPNFKGGLLWRRMRNAGATNTMVDMVQRMLHWNPKRRPTASRLLLHPYFSADPVLQAPEIAYTPPNTVYGFTEADLKFGAIPYTSDRPLFLSLSPHTATTTTTTTAEKRAPPVSAVYTYKALSSLVGGKRCLHCTRKVGAKAVRCNDCAATYCCDEHLKLNASKHTTFCGL